MYTTHISALDTLIPSNACLVIFHRKCGKSNCRCAKGEKHPFTGLKYRVKEHDRVIQKVKYLPSNSVAKIRQLLWQTKGLEILERSNGYIFSIDQMFPHLSGEFIHAKAYEVFGQQKYIKHAR